MMTLRKFGGAMLTRRQFAQAAASIGATLAIGCSREKPKAAWTERRECYPQGVASADPSADSVILWTRRAPLKGDPATSYRLTVEISRTADFASTETRATAVVTAASDYTTRFLAAGLAPATEYWYRFIDESGNGSRVGRTVTAPHAGDERAISFTFVSCQDITQGANNAWRRMIFEDERRPRTEQLGFVLHLGDFIYEVVDYPEDSKDGRRYGRKLLDLIRFPDGEKVRDFHLPTSLADYRLLYKVYLQDPDLQDARARWPFVPVWDNHEFSWMGYQGFQVFGGKARPAQTKKVMANQAWWEFQPARVARPGDPQEDHFTAPAVKDAPVETFDEHGFGTEPNNVAAVESLRIRRAFRYGKNAEMFLTDNRSYKNADADLAAFSPDSFPLMSDENAARIIDDGRTRDGGKPPATIRFGGKDIPNPGRAAPRQSYLGVKQRAWLIENLRASTAPWKLWGHSFGTMTWRTDPQNLPKGAGPKWPGAGYGLVNGGFYAEHAEIFDAVRANGITGFAIVAGDKHSFWAGLTAKDIPPAVFDPVGVEFVTGSISSLGLLEVLPYIIKDDDPLRALYLVGDKASNIPTINFTLLHGVRSALALAKDPSADKARALRNPDVAPHLRFVDLGGHGFGRVTVAPGWLETEFVCIPPPLERSEKPDGGPLRYRVTHRVPLWKAGEPPVLTQTLVEGDARYSI
jgi:alkaline phosphatase D